MWNKKKYPIINVECKPYEPTKSNIIVLHSQRNDNTIKYLLSFQTDHGIMAEDKNALYLKSFIYKHVKTDTNFL